MSADSQGRSDGPDFIKDTFDLIQFFIVASRVIAAPVEPWLRKPGTVGERYWGLPAAVGLVAFPMLCCLIGSTHPTLYEFDCIVLFWFGTVGFLLLHRIKRFQLQRRGVFSHSWSVGESWFDPKDGKDLLNVRTRFEVTAVLMVGLGLLPFSCGLGVTLGIAAVALIINSEMLRLQEAAQVRSLQDAFFEARRAADQMGGRMYG